MILRLALRSLATRPIRTAVLACGFGFGIAVMAALFDRVNRDGTAIVVVTHNLTLAARARIWLTMKSGMVVSQA